jgi:hypothetical protein
MEKLEIEVNNGCKLIVELKDRRLIFTKLDAKETIDLLLEEES